MRLHRRPLMLLVLLFAIGMTGCGDDDAEQFLAALKRGDYAAAHAQLDAEARARTPNAEAIKKSVTDSGYELVDYSWSCSSTSWSTKRIGYGPTTRGRGSPRPPIIVGVPPVRKGKCNTGLVVDLRKDDQGAWKVVGMKLE